MKIKVEDTREVWSSPDGQRTIYEVRVSDEAGTFATYQSFSDEIGKARVGTAFDVEVYDRTSKKTGSAEHFIRQLKTDDFGGGGGGGGGGKRPYVPTDRDTYYRAVSSILAAKDITECLLNTGQLKTNEDFDGVEPQDTIRSLATFFYNLTGELVK